MIDRAKKSGYKVNLVLVGIERLGRSRGRVLTRVNKGGHSVPSKDLARRFDCVYENISKALPKVHRAFIFDNSKQSPLLVAKLSRGKITKKISRVKTLDKAPHSCTKEKHQQNRNEFVSTKSPLATFDFLPETVQKSKRIKIMPTLQFLNLERR